MISDSDRDALRAMMPDLLRERFGITNLSRSFSCPSPNHDDSDPSAHYYKDGDTVHCFGCGKTWDVFSLIGEADGIDGFAEQTRAVADILGYRLDEDCSEEERRARNEAKKKRKAKAKAQPLFEKPRNAGAQDVGDACAHAFGIMYEPSNDIGRRYLRYRGLDDDDIARNGLGFTLDPREIMPQFRIYEPEALGFITIPFWNQDYSEAHYCMARTVSRGEVSNKEWRPKGVASPLWNEWMLSASLPVVYVAEGLLDAIVLNKVLGKPVCALGGIANAKRLAQVLYHTSPDQRPGSIVVCMDEDDEGRKTRDKICADLSKMRIAHSVLLPYPGGAKDADEWLMAGKGKDWDFEQFEGSLKGRPPLFRTRWRDGR